MLVSTSKEQREKNLRFLMEEVSKKSKETSGLFKKAYILFLLFKYVPLFREKEKTFDSVLK